MLAAPLREVTLHSNLEDTTAQDAVDELVQRGEIVSLEIGKGEFNANSDLLVTSIGYWEQLSSTTLNVVEEYHTTYPLRRGMPKEELKSRLKLSPRLFSGLIRILIQDDQLDEIGPLIFCPGHEIRFTPQQEQAVQSLLKKFAVSPYSPPSVKQAKSDVGDDVFQAMVDLDLLVPVSSEVVFRREVYDQMVADMKDMFQDMGTLSAAQVRDHFDTSRRYVLAFLEHLDEVGVTVREGDVRRLR
jgi:selenocysteine-specific elongation factor